MWTACNHIARVAAFLLALCACGASPTLPPCAPDGETVVPLPTNFPSTLPLPNGFRLFKTETLPGYADSIQLTGYAPVTLRGSYTYLRDALTRASYSVTFGEAEPNEIEMQFKSEQWQGAYRVNTLGTCSVTLWTIIALKR